MYFAEIQKITEIFYLIDVTQSITYFELLFFSLGKRCSNFPESKPAWNVIINTKNGSRGRSRNVYFLPVGLMLLTKLVTITPLAIPAPSKRAPPRSSRLLTCKYGSSEKRPPA